MRDELDSKDTEEPKFVIESVSSSKWSAPEWRTETPSSQSSSASIEESKDIEPAPWFVIESVSSTKWVAPESPIEEEAPPSETSSSQSSSASSEEEVKIKEPPPFVIESVSSTKWVAPEGAIYDQSAIEIAAYFARKAAEMADDVETSVETPVQSTSTDAVVVEVEMGRGNVDTSPLLDAVRAESPAVQLSEAVSKLIVALLCCSTLAVTMCFSVIVPFFPEEAVARGMEEWMTGIIVAIYQFTALASGLVYGTFGNDIGWRWMMIVGNLSLGFATALFGTLQWSPHGDTFVFLTVGIRGFQGLSGSAVNTAVLTLILKQFPNKAALLMGTMEAFAGSAYIIGPLIGGALFKEGGFLLPFVVCGGIVLIMGVVCIFLLPPQLDVIRTDDGASYKKLFAIPAVWLPILSLLAISVTMSFFDLTIAQHMDTYQMDIWAKVEMLALLSGIYLVMAPTWGWLVDKRGVYRQVMAVGAFINSVALLLLGPSPLILNEGSVWLLGVALSILGLGLGAQLIPPFADVLQTARLNGFPEDTGTLGRVSGLINTAIPLGSFVGPLAGGFVVERYGFAKSQTGLAGLNLLVFFMLCANFGYRWLIRRRLNRSLVDQSQHNEAT